MILFYWIMEYAASFTELFLCFYFCGVFITKDSFKTKKKEIVCYTIINALILIGFNCINIFSQVLSLIFTIVFLISLCLVYRKIIVTTVLMLIYMVILSAIDYLTANLVAFSLHVSTEYLLGEQSPKRVVCIFLSRAILILLMIFIKKIFGDKKVESTKYMLIVCLSSLFLLLSNFIAVGGIAADNEVFSIVFFIVSIMIELLLFYFMLSMAKYYEQKQTMMLIEMKNDMLQKSLDDTEQAFDLWRQSVHDYKNNIISLTQLADEGNLQEIKKYLQKENELISKKMFYIKTGNSMVDAIINTKQKIAEQKGIIFIVNAMIPEKCIVNGIDLSNILGNLIDNAIEASEKEKDAYVNINIRQEKKFFVMSVKNKFSGELEQDMKTTKEDERLHGIGIKSVKKIVEKYNGEFLFQKEQDEFVATILFINE